MSGFNQAIATDLANPAFLQQIAGYITGEQAPAIATGNLQQANAYSQLGTLVPGLQEGIAGANQTAGYGLADALLNYQGTQLSEQGLASQIGTAAQQQQIEQAQYPLQQQQIGISEQQTALQQANLAYQLPIEYQKQQSAAALSGATNSQGNKQAQGQIQQQGALQGSQLGLQGQSEYIQSQLASLGQESELAGYAGQQSQYTNEMQQLQLAAKQAGIPVQQAMSQLQYGIGQLGIQASPDQALNQASQGQSTSAQAYAAAIAQASASTGLGAQAFNPVSFNSPASQNAQSNQGTENVGGGHFAQ